MAKPNYQYEKRQRDLAKRKKKEEKAQKKAERAKTGDDGAPEPAADAAPEEGAA